eukprot:scaffold4212_cov122-Isochrysis_galbana.AAC.11
MLPLAWTLINLCRAVGDEDGPETFTFLQARTLEFGILNSPRVVFLKSFRSRRGRIRQTLICGIPACAARLPGSPYTFPPRTSAIAEGPACAGRSSGSS